MANNGVIPILSVNIDRLVTKKQQVAYILRHMFYNPGWTSSQIESYLISMRKILAQKQYDRNAFGMQLTRKLQEIFSHYFDDLKVQIRTPTNEEYPSRYNVQIYIYDNNGNLILSNLDIFVENGQLKLKYEGEINE